MRKLALLAMGIALFAAAPALATGVDQILYGTDELQPLDQMGNVYAPNEDYLYKQHNSDSNNDGGNGDLPDSNGGDDYNQPADEESGNAPVPEPGTGILLGVGVLGLARYIRRRKESKES